MRKVTLFIAMSVDGYIADPDGGIDWLGGESPDGDDMGSYNAFIQNVDTVVMGAKTYRQLVTELSPDEWVYAGLTSYVITHAPGPSTDEIRFTGEDPCRLVETLKAGEGKGIWICGGANIAQQLIRADLIDEYYLNIIPTILGRGIRLFDGLEGEKKLRLVGTKSYNGITDLVYQRR